jgi:hypothetical protein
MTNGWSASTIISVVAYGVPALLIAFGAIFILMGHTLEPFGITGLISDGWVFVILGFFIYFIEVCFYYYNEEERRRQERKW